MSERQSDNSIWKSYVWHGDRCFFVSTIERNYDTIQGTSRGHETIVWEYNWDKAERGAMLHQAGGLVDHKQICHCLIVEGIVPSEDEPRTFRFVTL